MRQERTPVLGERTKLEVQSGQGKKGNSKPKGRYGSFMSNYHNSLPGFVETSSQVTERSVLIANIQMQTPPQWATSFVVSLENQGLSGLSI